MQAPANLVAHNSIRLDLEAPMTDDGRPVLLTRREWKQVKAVITDLRERVEDLEQPTQGLTGEAYKEHLRRQDRARKRKARNTNGSR